MENNKASNQTQPRSFVIKNNIPSPPVVLPAPSINPLVNVSSNVSKTESTLKDVLCGPYPPCNPFGCGPGVAPVNCPDCNSTAVGFALFGMCLIAILIVFTNILVITVISRNVTLRRRHGYIKVSLAVADLLIGLFVLPSAIYNLLTTLYLPPPLQEFNEQNGSYFKNQVMQFEQKNSIASVFFGTIWVISLVTSIYNLLLLSLDRLFAIARPMQTQTGKLLSEQRLKYCLGAIWIIGLVVSSFPTFIPSRFAYILDYKTFFFVQEAVVKSETDIVAFIIFIFVIFFIPYLATVIISLFTMFLTIQKLKFSQHNSTRMATTEQKKRLKMILDSCPEMKYEKKHTKMQLLKKGKFNDSSNNAHSIANEQSDTAVSTTLERRKNIPSTAREMNTKVTVMILTMVFAFTISIFPFAMVSILTATGSIGCFSLGPTFNIVLYFLFFNSSANFFIYNLWHKEFRQKLIRAFKDARPSSSQKATSTTSAYSDKRHTLTLASSRGRTPTSVYRAKRAKGGFSLKSRQHNSLERETHF